MKASARAKASIEVMLPTLTLGLLAGLALAHPINETRQPPTAAPRCAHEDKSCITPTEYIEIATKPMPGVASMRNGKQ